MDYEAKYLSKQVGEAFKPYYDSYQWDWDFKNAESLKEDLSIVFNADTIADFSNVENQERELLESICNCIDLYIVFNRDVNWLLETIRNMASKKLELEIGRRQKENEND